jgi:hypothetical protein
LSAVDGLLTPFPHRLCGIPPQSHFFKEDTTIATKKVIKERYKSLEKLGFSAHSIDELITQRQDGSYESLEVMAASNWQNPTNFSTALSTVTELSNLFPLSSVDDALPSDLNWRELQDQSYKYSKTFGPLRSMITQKSQMAAGKGFGFFSPILDVNEFLKDLFLSPRNRLDRKMVGIMQSMKSVVECFLLISLDETGSATVRPLDEKRIGQGKAHGLVTDPDDVTATMFYLYRGGVGQKPEFIPDARFIYEPEEILKIRMDRLKKSTTTNFDEKQIAESTLKPKLKGIFGGYRRFILHWKNLDGIDHILRDTSSVATTLEWINLYVHAMKWELDYKRALSSFVIVMGFESTPEGRVAAAKWLKMTDAERERTGLTKPLSPGSRVWLIPGMTLEIKAPQLPRLSQENQDLINMAGSGARMPTDIWSGHSSNTNFAALKLSRAPLSQEIEYDQYALEMFLRRDLVFACGVAKIKVGGGKFTGIASLADPTGKGQEYTLMPTYPMQWVSAMSKGKPTFQTVNVEFWHESVMSFEFPIISLEGDVGAEANMLMGSKHTGALGLKISQSSVAKRLTGGNLDKEVRKRAIEDETYGEPVSGAEALVAGAQPPTDPNTPTQTKPTTNLKPKPDIAQKPKP